MSNQNIRVLVAEDDLEIAALLRTTLEDAGYQTNVVHDGEAALAAAIDDKPDLIVLDVMMPQMNGWEVCKSLRARGDFGDVLLEDANGVWVRHHQRRDRVINRGVERGKHEEAAAHGAVHQVTAGH